MKVGIHQPNYLPWCGYFAKVRAVDVFVLLDDVQYPKGSYVNRTRILGPQGVSWLSAPVHRSSTTPIHDVTFADEGWALKHRRRLEEVYGDAPHYTEVMAMLEPMYADPGTRLGDFNIRVIRLLAERLDIRTEFVVSSEIGAQGTSDDRLVSLVQRVGGTCYVSGKGGQNYQDPAKFEAAGLALEVRPYEHRSYPQEHSERFVPGLSIVDAFFSVGPAVRELLG